MAKSTLETGPKRSILTSRRVIVTILGTLLLGAAGSGLWDIVFKPSLTKGGRLILTVLTLGSDRIRDLAYESAALDPTPVSSLVMVIQLSAIPFLIAITVGFVEFGAPRLRLKLESKIVSDQSSGKSDPRQRFSRRMAVFIIVWSVIFGIFTYTSAKVLNQSILIWRTFHADLAICAPVLSQEQQKLFSARFASMRTRAEYKEIHEDLAGVASSAGLKLIPNELW